MDVWKEVEDERRELGDLLEGLTPEQWEAQTLCDAWKVRHIVAHVSQSTMSMLRFFRGLPAAGFDFNKVIAKDAIRNGSADTAAVLERFRQDITLHKVPPGLNPTTVLSDIVLHHQDIRRPLGMLRGIPTDRLIAVADEMKGRRALGNKQRIAGMRLVAADADWWHGDGPEVTGTLEALTMAMCGRKPPAADLSGEGLETLLARL